MGFALEKNIGAAPLSGCRPGKEEIANHHFSKAI